jgi:DNA modification methylase
MNQKNRLICGDALKVLTNISGKFDCLIADPPDNIGLKYKSYKDNMSYYDYTLFLKDCIWTFIHKSNLIWISFNSKWIFSIGEVVNYLTVNRPAWEAKIFINTFTFGQNNKKDCGNGYRPLLRLKHKDATLYPDAIKIPSWRELNGDKRAAKGGKVPLDVWNFERITGNCKERRSWHPTQLREDMIKRIINFSTKPGDSVLDVFSGTGTLLRACKDRDITSVELDKFYCKEISKEHNLKIEYL